MDSTNIPASNSTNMHDVDEHEEEGNTNIDHVTPSSAPPVSSASSKPPKPPSIARLYCEPFKKFNPKQPKVKDEYPYLRCKTCQKEFSAHTTIGGLSNIKHYLKHACVNSPINEGKKTLGGQTTLSQDAFGGPLVPHNFNQKRHEKMLCEMVVRDEMAFRVVEGGILMEVHLLQQLDDDSSSFNQQEGRIFGSFWIWN